MSPVCRPGRTALHMGWPPTCTARRPATPRSLVLDHNYELGSAPLDALARLTALQELNLSECTLASFPRQVGVHGGRAGREWLTPPPRHVHSRKGASKPHGDANPAPAV